MLGPFVASERRPDIGLSSVNRPGFGPMERAMSDFYRELSTPSSSLAPRTSTGLLTTLRRGAVVLGGLTAFTLLTGARSCSGGAAYPTGYETYPVEPGPAIPVGGGVVTPGPALLIGDIALTAYATPETMTFNVIVREESAYGPVVLEGTDFVFDAAGAGAVDIVDLPYGLYDVELVGLDAWGAAVSYAATSLVIEEPVTVVSMVLESTLASPAPVPVDPGPVVVVEPTVEIGDVALDIWEPDGGAIAGYTDTIDYYLWVWDEWAADWVFVESIGYIPFDPAEPPIIPSLTFGSYYLEVDGFDVMGARIYAFSGSFDHYASWTSLPVDFDYAQ